LEVLNKLNQIEKIKIKKRKNNLLRFALVDYLEQANLSPVLMKPKLWARPSNQIDLLFHTSSILAHLTYSSPA
jgi:hypothetical protein